MFIRYDSLSDKTLENLHNLKHLADLNNVIVLMAINDSFKLQKVLNCQFIIILLKKYCGKC
jgi:hypothetical protein